MPVVSLPEYTTNRCVALEEWAVDSNMNPSEDGAIATAGLETETFRLRSYQAEMVQESLKANIIVAMDTGSGKTHIAIARTSAELEACDPNMRVWFLAPTVALCEQQFRVFKTHLPGYGIQVLSGKDNVDHWTDQATWDEVLNNVRIVLSTHAVLLDALTHAFVKMSELALIIFDEAHHCTGKHPASQIMGLFYIPLAQNTNNHHLPKILGLSASPVNKANASDNALREIEQKMHAITKTPKLHRSELLQFVHKPELLRMDYRIEAESHTPLLAALEKALTSYDLMSDPYVTELMSRQRNGYDTSRQLQKVFQSDSTYCKAQLKALVNKGRDTSEELGPSATDWYLKQCISRFKSMVHTTNGQLFDWTSQEKQYLLNIFQQLQIPDAELSFPLSLEQLSPKVNSLIDLLVSEASSTFTGLVFVEQRVWISTLAEILALHPRTKTLFDVGTFVGTSQSTRRKTSVANLAEPRNQKTTLDDFREGKTNLILATSVLEEGIDVSNCHLVICFERPKNLKSFVQRRGRARKQQSKYFIFSPMVGNVRPPETWESLEEEMKKAYLDDLREVEQAKKRELTEEYGDLVYEIPSTHALLTLDNASQHLHHFCSIVGSGPYVDPRPQFHFTYGELSGSTMVPLISAGVTLPISVDPSVRSAHSAKKWATERMAKNDAAFQAYKALHSAGLVNDNLLPLQENVENDEMAGFQVADDTPGLVEVSPIFDPWVRIAQTQQENAHAYYRTLLKITAPGEEPIFMVLLMPIDMPQIPDYILHWNESKRYSVESAWLQGVVLAKDEIHIMRLVTRKILYSVFQSRMSQSRYDFLWLFFPSDSAGAWDTAGLEDWNIQISGHRPAIQLLQEGHQGVSDWGLVWIPGDPSKYIPKSANMDVMESTSSGNTGPEIQVIRTPKRRDFLHRVVDSSNVNDAYTRLECFNAADCMVDNLPAVYSIFGLLAPSILYKYEVSFIADNLRTTILKPLCLESSHNPLILIALTSSATGEDDNYQRLEFLGDCILKLLSSVHLMAAHLTKPESWLTGKKGKIVSNGFLARSTLRAGLDKFIITKRFTGAKWIPRYAADVLNPQSFDKPRPKSSKLLADVIESLIGASYLIGGFSKAFTCMRTLLPLETWTPLPTANTMLYNSAPDSISPTNLTVLESLIGHTFSKKMLLLQALTHGSYHAPIAADCSSYERLEFLGDAVLDYIISRRLYAHRPPLSHRKMHAMRSAMANASFLAFRMFETSVPEPMVVPKTLRYRNEPRALWMFMRHSEPMIVALRDVALDRHQLARTQILAALRRDAKFPWHLLSLTDAPKFLSDIVESVIGAVYVDSGGSVEACEGFVGRLGILEALGRILRDGVDCLHPKERLGHLAVEKSVQYVKVDADGGGHGMEGEAGQSGMYRVQIKVGDVNVGGVEEGIKRLNAETIAAWKAVRIIEGVGDLEMRVDEDAEEKAGNEEEDEDEDEWFDAEDGRAQFGTE